MDNPNDSPAIRLGWERWIGVGGLYYARLRKTSPPVVLRAATLDELIKAVLAWEAEHRT